MSNPTIHSRPMISARPSKLKLKRTSCRQSSENGSANAKQTSGAHADRVVFPHESEVAAASSGHAEVGINNKQGKIAAERDGEGPQTSLEVFVGILSAGAGATDSCACSGGCELSEQLTTTASAPAEAQAESVLRGAGPRCEWGSGSQPASALVSQRSSVAPWTLQSAGEAELRAGPAAPCLTRSHLRRLLESEHAVQQLCIQEDGDSVRCLLCGELLLDQCETAALRHVNGCAALAAVLLEEDVQHPPEATLRCEMPSTGAVQQRLPQKTEGELPDRWANLRPSIEKASAPVGLQQLLPIPSTSDGQHLAAPAVVALAPTSSHEGTSGLWSLAMEFSPPPSQRVAPAFTPFISLPAGELPTEEGVKCSTCAMYISLSAGAVFRGPAIALCSRCAPRAGFQLQLEPTGPTHDRDVTSFLSPGCASRDLATSLSHVQRLLRTGGARAEQLRCGMATHGLELVEVAAAGVLCAIDEASAAAASLQGRGRSGLSRFEGEAHTGKLVLEHLLASWDAELPLGVVQVLVQALRERAGACPRLRFNECPIRYCLAHLRHRYLEIYEAAHAISPYRVCECLRRTRTSR